MPGGVPPHPDDLSSSCQSAPLEGDRSSSQSALSPSPKRGCRRCGPSHVGGVASIESTGRRPAPLPSAAPCLLHYCHRLRADAEASCRTSPPGRRPWGGPGEGGAAPDLAAKAPAERLSHKRPRRQPRPLPVYPRWSRGDSRGRRPQGQHWLGSSLSSEPRDLAGLSVPWHAGVLTRSKIGGSLLCGLSRPWHGLGLPEAPTDRDQRYSASPQIFFACGGRSILFMLSNRRLSILLFRFSLLLLLS